MGNITSESFHIRKLGVRAARIMLIDISHSSPCQFTVNVCKPSCISS
uniref:Uncharacterized protein n=1 Tax=Arundo donax TaxID=35708 RepID=A0A0A9ERC5_ARUDO